MDISKRIIAIAALSVGLGGCISEDTDISVTPDGFMEINSIYAINIGVARDFAERLGAENVADICPMLVQYENPHDVSYSFTGDTDMTNLYCRAHTAGRIEHLLDGVVVDPESGGREPIDMLQDLGNGRWRILAIYSKLYAEPENEAVTAS